MLEIVCTYYPLLEQVSSLIAQLDVLASFAAVSVQNRWVKPKILGDGPEEERSGEDD